ncbi:DivIVA domain-containing protein [Micromonospora mangrovi]|uniref:DivIVA domain-containing protein n=2 Tax=Micromonospora TaxID=1873 RepID=A0AAU7M383_9ACTN
MGEVLLLLVVALTVAAVVFGVTVLVSGRDPGLAPAEPDGRAVPLPGSRPLREADVAEVRFDTALRGYRMAQVDQAMRRAAYDIGYKSELIGVLEAEVAALREGRTAEADALRRAREESAGARADGDTPPAEGDAAVVDGPAADESAAPATDPTAGAGADVVAAPAVTLRPPADPTAPAEPALAEPAPVEAGSVADATAPVDGTGPEATGADATGPERVDATAAGADDVEGERDRGPVVRSESA